MYSLSADGRLAAIPLRPKVVKPRETATNVHTGAIQVWNLETGKELHSIPFDKAGYGTGHAFTPDGKKLITTGEKPYFHIWDVASGKEVAHAPAQFGERAGLIASSIAISTDGKRFATGRRDGRIDVWDTATAEPLIALDTHRRQLASAVVSPDGRLTATLDTDSAVRVWELANGKPVCAVPAPGPAADPYAVPKNRLVFTPDSRGLVFTSRGGLAQVDPLTGKLLDLPGGAPRGQRFRQRILRGREDAGDIRPGHGHTLGLAGRNCSSDRHRSTRATEVGGERSGDGADQLRGAAVPGRAAPVHHLGATTEGQAAHRS
jgi:WD40 repeat protein